MLIIYLVFAVFCDLVQTKRQKKLEISKSFLIVVLLLASVKLILAENKLRKDRMEIPKILSSSIFSSIDYFFPIMDEIRNSLIFIVYKN